MQSGDVKREENVLLFMVYDRMASKEVVVMKDTEVDKGNYDTRIYDIIPMHLYDRMQHKKPIAILPVAVQAEDGNLTHDGIKYTIVNVPIFTMGDLHGLRVVGTHYVNENTFNSRQLAWMNANNAGRQLMEV